LSIRSGVISAIITEPFDKCGIQGLLKSVVLSSLSAICADFKGKGQKSLVILCNPRESDDFKKTLMGVNKWGVNPK
jgi:hypothetical protein